MTATVDFEQDPAFLFDLLPDSGSQRLPEAEDDGALLAVYQQIADRRAQVENAEILRRARAL